MGTSVIDVTTGRLLVAIEAGPQSKAVIAAATRLARRSHDEVLVLSVRERGYTRGFAWDTHQPGEIAETVSHAIYELRRAGVPAWGVIRTARTGRIADEIVYAAHKHHVDEIVIGASRRSPWGRFSSEGLTARVLRLSQLPVVTVPVGQLQGAQDGRPASALETGPKR